MKGKGFMHNLIPHQYKKMICLFAVGVVCGLSYIIGKNDNVSTFTLNETIPQKETKNENQHLFDSTKTRTFYPRKPKEVLVFDLNQCDTLDLQALSGIGPAYSRWIISYREQLGGYVKLEQLQEVYGMTEELYNKILPHLKITSVKTKKININTANIKQLMHHPYIDFHLAKAIIEFRQTHGNYQSIEDLKKVAIMDEVTFQKLYPYIETQTE